MTDENKADKAPESPKRHAVYDDTLGQFVGGVHATKADANKAKSEAAKTARHDGHELTVRDV
jgi:hypothetical protein